MKYIVDTHILVWYMTNSSRLKRKIRKILDNPQNKFVIPIIVLAEIKYLIFRKKINVNYRKLINVIGRMDNVLIYNVDINVIEKMPLSLDIHDALIVATGLVFKELFNEEIKILTIDKDIINFGKISVI